ncbi:MAG: L-ribulose-5-phosphate 4-epimerase [Verrucomicrobia bacterium]|nr:MAG: L-ribulose-5-phosphate 4-epimerase [Verrucomicrobiota bacterium]
MLTHLKEEVCQANLDLVKEGLVIHTWGNASGIDRSRGLMVIKPSGVPYERMKPDHMVVVALDSGKVVEGKLNPSSDTPTHLLLYRAFKNIGGVVHTHSFCATAWAQTGRAVPALGTTHADYFHGAVPCTRPLRPREIKNNYETETGKIIVETFKSRDPLSCPAVLVANHGPFAWGRSIREAVHNAVILEHVVRLAAETFRNFPGAQPMRQELLDKHFFRKHGPAASYGQVQSSSSSSSNFPKHPPLRGSRR